MNFNQNVTYILEKQMDRILIGIPLLKSDGFSYCNSILNKLDRYESRVNNVMVNCAFQMFLEIGSVCNSEDQF